MKKSKLEPKECINLIKNTNIRFLSSQQFSYLSMRVDRGDLSFCEDMDLSRYRRDHWPPPEEEGLFEDEERD